MIQWKKEVEEIRKGSGIKKIDAIVKMTAALCSGSAQDAYLAVIGEMRDKRKANAEEWKKAHPLDPQGEDELDDDYNTRKAEWNEEPKRLAKLQRKRPHDCSPSCDLGCYALQGYYQAETLHETLHEEATQYAIQNLCGSYHEDQQGSNS